jgi:hypothetical protein
LQVTVLDETMAVVGSGNLERSPGLHLSDVIRDLEKALGTDRSGSGWDMDPTWNTGLLWEEVLSTAYRDHMIIRVGEVVKDGIIMTPDGLNIDTYELEEYKATWKSSKNKPWDNNKWMWQVKAYCLALDTLVCVMRVLYVVGDYKGSGPQYVCCRLQFTELELAENWQMLVNHSREMRRRDDNST